MSLCLVLTSAEPPTRYSILWCLSHVWLLIIYNRSISFSSTRTQRPASTKRSTSRVLHRPRSTKRLRSTPSLSTKTTNSRSRLTANQARRVTFSTISPHQSILSERLTTPRIPSQKTGLTRLESQTQKRLSPRTGMRTLHSMWLTRRLPNPKTGLRMSPPWFQTQRLRSPRIGMMRKTVTGSRPWYQTPNVKKSLAAVNGNPPPRRTQTTRANGRQNTLTTQPTRVYGSQRRSPTLTSLRTRFLPSLSPWAL